MELMLSQNGSSNSLLYSTPRLTVPYISVISLASVVGTLGNLLVIGSLGGSVRCRNPRTVGKIFIVNLACSDLIVTSVINPMAIAGAIVGPSLFDGGRQWMCTLFASLCIGSCVVSLLSVGAISINRYVYICHQAAYRRLFNRRACFAIVVATWLIAAALDVPCHTGWSAHTFDHKTQKCLWDRTLSHQYTLFYVTVGMLLPLVIIVLCYWRIFAHIRQAKLRILQARNHGCCGCLKTWNSQAAIVKSIRQIKVIFIIFLVFCICWAPYAIVLLSDERDEFPLSVHLYASMIAHLHASVNFFIYGLTNKSLHAGYYDFVVNRLFGVCHTRAPDVKTGYSPAKDDVFTDPAVYARQKPRPRVQPSPPGCLSSGAKQQEPPASANEERAAEQVSP